MSRVEFHRIKDLQGRVVWAYQVCGVDLIRYMCCPVVGDEAVIFAHLGFPPNVLKNFKMSLNNHLERWFIPDGWVVDLPSEIVDAVNACLDGVIAEQKKTEEINQALGFGKRG